jgi:hypothetical protein
MRRRACTPPRCCKRERKCSRDGAIRADAAMFENSDDLPTQTPLGRVHSGGGSSFAPGFRLTGINPHLRCCGGPAFFRVVTACARRRDVCAPYLLCSRQCACAQLCPRRLTFPVCVSDRCSVLGARASGPLCLRPRDAYVLGGFHVGPTIGDPAANCCSIRVSHQRKRDRDCGYDNGNR